MLSRGQRNGSPQPLISVFKTRSRYFSIQVVPRLYSRGWVDSQELWPLAHRGGHPWELLCKILYVVFICPFAPYVRPLSHLPWSDQWIREDLLFPSPLLLPALCPNILLSKTFSDVPNESSHVTMWQHTGATNRHGKTVTDWTVVTNKCYHEIPKFAQGTLEGRSHAKWRTIW
jgi:hypothetical protein